MLDWVHYLDRMFDCLASAWTMSHAPTWNFIKSFSCGWIAASIMRFKPCEGMAYKPAMSMAATLLFVLCIMELARVITGIASGVPPFVSITLLITAYRLHRARGNIANLCSA